GENALFLTATVLVEPACAGPTATAAPIEATAATAASLRSMSTPSESIAVPTRTPRAGRLVPSRAGTSVQRRGRRCVTADHERDAPLCCASRAGRARAPGLRVRRGHLRPDLPP